jgi:hypothetical protein
MRLCHRSRLTRKRSELTKFQFELLLFQQVA